MLKPLANQKCYGGRDVRTDRHGKVKSRVSATKNVNNNNFFSPLYPFWAAALEGKFFHVLLLRLLCPPYPIFKSQPPGPNPSFKVQIPALRPNLCLMAQFPASRPKSQPYFQFKSPNLSPEA